MLYATLNVKELTMTSQQIAAELQRLVQACLAAVKPLPVHFAPAKVMD